MNELPEFFTIEEFCRRFATSKSNVYREIAAGRLKLRKLGHASRIAVTDAREWVAQLPIVSGEAA
jgi:excisionase family DNA binding protein